MKTLTLKELNAKASKFFEKAHVSEIFATSDGQFFFNKGDASNHAGPKGNVFDFKKEDFESSEENEPIKLSAQEVIKFILEAQNLEDLAKYATDERKTVKAAFEKRSEELETDVDQEEEEVEVTQELLNANPDLVDLGVAIGEKIKIPKV
ncbi:hypothetical protein KO02_16405 [Sphingobacterium sp. ML3W]|uniref:hypothetical protein n=1 Tax=Sphingobacterium sp. ML3W TaxID=1538644 RepID=UPI0004F7112F|nr:hypothetical protein [Sphingobacterium sp. ML3W]AIM38089.1 hypothetical protein KO02_16405 [Sphingobacterium sp. ML3W]